MRLPLLALVLSFSVFPQTNSLPALGAPAGAIALTAADGKPLKLDALTENGPALLVLFPGGESYEICTLASRAAKVGEAEKIERVLVLAEGTASPADCGTGKVVRLAQWRGPGSLGAPVALIVDDSLHVRLLQPLAAGDAGWATLDIAVTQWFQGRQAYEVNCGHCHGFDGAQASAPETKSLVGITRKYPDAKVLELGAQFGGVDMNGWSDAKKETLLSYLRGL